MHLQRFFRAFNERYLYFFGGVLGDYTVKLRINTIYFATLTEIHFSLNAAIPIIIHNKLSVQY